MDLEIPILTTRSLMEKKTRDIGQYIMMNSNTVNSFKRNRSPQMRFASEVESLLKLQLLETYEESLS